MLASANLETYFYLTGLVIKYFINSQVNMQSCTKFNLTFFIWSLKLSNDPRRFWNKDVKPISREF